MIIREATTGDCNQINRVLRASKSNWGYDAAFIDLFMLHNGLTFRYIETSLTHVGLMDQQIMGFYSVAYNEDRNLELDHLFVDPDYMGRGHGQSLWNHCVMTLKDHGAKEFYIWSDPHAINFYTKQGCEQIGVRASDMAPERINPVLVYRL